MKVKRTIFCLAMIVIGVILFNDIFFAVDETQQLIVTHFGRPVKVVKEAGLKLKWPSPIQTIARFDKRILIYESYPNEFLTGDKKNIVVSTLVTWSIDDPLRFFQTVKDKKGAEQRITDIVTSELGVALGKLPMSSLITVEPGQVRIPQMMQGVTENSRTMAEKNYGIKIIEARMKRLYLPDQNLESVFARMRAERERIAKKYRAEGQREAMKIRAQAQRDKEGILAEAIKEAEIIKGEADAEVARIYAHAFKKDPTFYKLLRTLECYKKFLNEKSTVVLSSESELLQLLTRGKEGLYKAGTK